MKGIGPQNAIWLIGVEDRIVELTPDNSHTKIIQPRDVLGMARIVGYVTIKGSSTIPQGFVIEQGFMAKLGDMMTTDFSYAEKFTVLNGTVLPFNVSIVAEYVRFRITSVGDATVCWTAYAYPI